MKEIIAKLERVDVFPQRLKEIVRFDGSQLWYLLLDFGVDAT